MKKTRIHQNWTFWKSGCEDAKMAVELPHDAMLLEKREPEMELGSGSGYFPGGLYYYSKTFFGEECYASQSVILEFEGVYMNSSVYLNGERVGGWIYGYTGFFVDITGKLIIGMENTLTVVADNTKTPNSRWYTGSGIYRPVNLWTGGLCHFAPEGLRVKTLSTNPAVIEVSAEIKGVDELSSHIEYRVYEGERCIADATGNPCEIPLPGAKLWSADEPNRYTLTAILSQNGEELDCASTTFGVRTLAWSVQDGLQVNGQTVKLRGGCLHHDHGILGACTYDKAEYRRVKKLKEFGFNAIRYSHCPAGKNFLAACDELGMYVLDESFDQWRRPNTKYDYSISFDAECEKDIAALARKDYNHPSVIMYCIGNEIPDTGRSYGTEIARNLYRILKEIDGTRPVTIANNAPMSLISAEMEKLETERGAEIGSLEINELITANPQLASFFKKGVFSAAKLEEIVGKVFDELDIAGHNYGHEFYEGLHKHRPDRILLSAETFPSQMASNWKAVIENNHCIGDFLWTAWDYLGETGVGLPVYGTTEAPFAKPYPCLTAACGSFDLLGFPEAAAYYEAILWGVYTKPYIAVRPVDHSGEPYTVGRWRLTDAIDSWTWDGCEEKKAEITVYSKGVEAELLQDGRSLGRKVLCECKAEFEAEYQKGTLEAVSYDQNGTELSRSQLSSAGEQICLHMYPEETEIRASTEEIVYVPIVITDENGILRRGTDKRVTVTVEGAGQLLALGSGRPAHEESFQSTQHTSWQGRVLAIIRSSGEPGTISVTASARDCENVSTVIQAV